MRRLLVPWVAVLALAAAACGSSAASGDSGKRGAGAVVVTYPVLGAVVKQVVGGAAPVVVLMPNGTDPHEWKPSPKDVEAMNDARLVVANGLDLEVGLEDALDEVRANGVPVFEAADHVEHREAGEGEPTDEHGHGGHGHGAEDPHLWMSAQNMAEVAGALTAELGSLGLDVQATGAAAVADLETLDTEVEDVLSSVPPERRKLVTGHESLGYFADHYGFELVGAVVPGLSSEAAVSAGALAELKDAIEAAGVPAIFTELGTPTAVVKAIAAEAGAEVVELPTHTLTRDGTYRGFLVANAQAIADALGSPG